MVWSLGTTLMQDTSVVEVVPHTASCTVVERRSGNSCFVNVAAILAMRGKEFDNLCILSSVGLTTMLLASC